MRKRVGRMLEGRESSIEGCGGGGLIHDGMVLVSGALLRVEGRTGNVE